MADESELHPAGPEAGQDTSKLAEQWSNLWAKFLALPHDDELTEVERTARFVAGLRALDCKSSPCPLLDDPLSELLAGSTGLERAKALLQMSPAAASTPAGQHNHNSLAARAFVVDQQILKALEGLRSHAAKIQVVNLGSGMDTRPWRLDGLGPDVDWWEIDTHDMITLKHKLLTEAGAELTQRLEMQGQQQQAATTESPAPAGQQQAAEVCKAAPPVEVGFLLRCGSLTMTACTLAASEQGVGLKHAILASDFDRRLPTIWVAEGLFMYLDLATLRGLLSDMAHLSPTGSTAIITTISKEAVGVVRAAVMAARESGLTKLNQFWMHTCVEDLTGGPQHPGLLPDLGWSVAELVPDFATLLPGLAPGHCSQGSAFLAPLRGVEGLLVATRT